MEELCLLTNRERRGPDVANRARVGEIRLVAQAPQIRNRDRVLVVVLGDVGAARSPRRHAARELRIDGLAGVAVVREAQRAEIERPSRRTRDYLAVANGAV